jgi:hypothetical protein
MPSKAWATWRAGPVLRGQHRQRGELGLAAELLGVIAAGVERQLDRGTAGMRLPDASRERGHLPDGCLAIHDAPRQRRTATAGGGPTRGTWDPVSRPSESIVNVFARTMLAYERLLAASDTTG